MADNDQPSRLEAATVKAEAGSQIVSDFANLPADQTVATASGNIPTLAGVIGVIQDEGDQAAADVRAKADAQVQAAIGTLVKKAGDSMTGPLILSGDPTSSLGAAPKRYVDTGDNNTLSSSKAYADQQLLTAKNYTDQQVSAVPKPFSKYFESGDFVISSGALISVLHGLGSRPKFVGATLICKVASAGYQVGDTIEFVSHSMDSSPARQICEIYYDSSRVYIQIANGNPQYSILTKNGSGASTTLSLGSNNFNVIIRAFI